MCGASLQPGQSETRDAPPATNRLTRAREPAILAGMRRSWLRRSLPLALALLTLAAGRPPNVPFTVRPIDPGASETAAVADIDGNRRLDIVSGDFWYQAPAWTPHRFREIAFVSNYVDAFSDLPIDVDADGRIDLVTVSWFARRIVWYRNPGKTGGTWTEQVVDSGFPVEFAQLVDLDNDGRARELLPQSGDAKAPLAWYEVKNGAWVKHVVSPQSYGHGIGAGDVNGDGRADILTPKGWFEAPADPRAGPGPADWDNVRLRRRAELHPTDAGAVRLPPRQSMSTAMDGTATSSMGGPTRRALARAAARTADGPGERSTAAGPRRHASTLVDLNGDGPPGPRDRQAIHGPQRQGSRRDANPGRLLVPAVGRGAAAARRMDQACNRLRRPGRRGDADPGIDIDGDGNLDLVCAGKSGLVSVENLTKRPAAR